MTKTTETPIANGKAQILAELNDLRAKLVALPDAGNVLFNPETKLAVSFVDDDPLQPRILGLIFARIFTDAERYGRIPCPHLANAISDGAGRPFKLFGLANAKRQALAAADGAIVTIEAIDFPAAK